MLAPTDTCMFQLRQIIQDFKFYLMTLNNKNKE